MSVTSIFLKEILNETLIAEEFDDLRKIRNSINYYGKDISVQEARDILERMTILRDKILGLLK